MILRRNAKRPSLFQPKPNDLERYDASFRRLFGG
jgi:hypothetical protein